MNTANNHPRQKSPLSMAKPARDRYVSHDIALKTCIQQGGKIQLTTLSGECFRGRLLSFDQWSITIMPDDAAWPLTFFKGALESFTRIDKREKH